MIKNYHHYYKGYQFCIANSFSLSETAKVAAKKNNFGLACSLNILAAEEAIKGFSILLELFYVGNRNLNISNLFFSHKVKHLNIIEFIESLEDVSKIVLKDLYGSKTKSEIKSMEKLRESQLIMKNIKKWIKQANSEKNAGLYVDLVNGKWKSPYAFTKDCFENERKFTEGILNSILFFEKFYNRFNDKTSANIGLKKLGPTR